MIEKGMKVKVAYTGTLDDGTVFDSSEGKEPLTFIVGVGQVIKGFDDAILSMALGEEKDISLPPEQAYGEMREELVQKIPRTQLPPEATEGSIVGVTLPTGQQVPATIVALDEENITLDLNPPLAGKTLHFHLKVVEVSKDEDTNEDSLEQSLDEPSSEESDSAEVESKEV